MDLSSLLAVLSSWPNIELFDILEKGLAPHSSPIQIIVAK